MANPPLVQRRGRLRWPVFALVLLCIGALQWPFLLADADSGLGWSRGPYTDEALYTLQARNALVTGHLDLAETDGFIKEPLFAAGAWGVQAAFGDTMLAMRAAVMLACAAVLAWLAATAGDVGRSVRLAVPLAFLSYLPFHYGHLAMAEVPCSVAVLVALVLLHRRFNGGSAWALAGASAAILVAYALKIQFVYVAVIPPLACVLVLLLRWAGGLPVRRQHAADVLIASAWAVGFAALFVALWVLPQRELFTSILGAQASERTASSAQLPHLVAENLRELLRQRGIWPLLLVLATGLVCAARAWRGSRGDAARRTAWIALLAPPLAWVAIETHKLVLPYLPSRYYVSSLLALALVGTAGIATLGPWRRIDPTAWRRAVPTVLLLALALNIAFYARSLGHREYALHGIQQALAAEGTWRGKTVVGPWAPALFWGTGAIAKPVWRDAFNDKQILATLKPAAIVSEPDQKDSHNAFALDGVVLPAKPDQRVKVHAFEINLYRWPQGDAPVAALEAARGPARR